jgi:hypothetical protein
MSRFISSVFGSVVLAEVVLLAFFAGDKMAAQAQGQSASDLIKFLTYQSGRPDSGLRSGVTSCGEAIRAAQDDRRAANSLVSLGVSAIPDIEKALSSLEKNGGQSPVYFNGSWLLVTYAGILGPKAYPRLERMLGNPTLGMERALGAAIAISLGLTSYVDSSSRIYERTIACGAREPRDALDGLILAWERNDREALYASLGPVARAVLESRLTGQTWQQFRAGFWRGGLVRSVAVGYRLEASGSWAQPSMTLDEAVALSRIVVDVSAIPVNPQLEARFTDRKGQECGEQRVRFHTAQDSVRTLMYFVDSPDLVDLLRLVSNCASQGN